LRLGTSCIDGWQKRNWPCDPLQPAVSPDTDCLATERLGDRLSAGCRLAMDPLVRRRSRFDTACSCEQASQSWVVDPFAAELRVHPRLDNVLRRVVDEKGSRSTALCTRTNLDGRRSLSHRLATLRTDHLKRHGGEPLVDLRVSPTTLPKDRITPEGVISWTATDSVDTPRPPDRVQTTVDTPVAQSCDRAGSVVTDNRQHATWPLWEPNKHPKNSAAREGYHVGLRPIGMTDVIPS